MYAHIFSVVQLYLVWETSVR